MYKQTNKQREKQTDKQTNKQFKQPMQTNNANKQTKQSIINPWFVTMIYSREFHS